MADVEAIFVRDPAPDPYAAAQQEVNRASGGERSGEGEAARAWQNAGQWHRTAQVEHAANELLLVKLDRLERDLAQSRSHAADLGAERNHLRDVLTGQRQRTAAAVRRAEKAEAAAQDARFYAPVPIDPALTRVLAAMVARNGNEVRLSLQEMAKPPDGAQLQTYNDGESGDLVLRLLPDGPFHAASFVSETFANVEWPESIPDLAHALAESYRENPHNWSLVAERAGEWFGGRGFFDPPQITDLARKGYELSLYAASIRWSQNETNTREWLNGLQVQIEAVQGLAEKLGMSREAMCKTDGIRGPKEGAPI